MNQNLTIGRPLVILTGGIATGKSSVAQRLRQHGIEVVDTDAIAHALTAPNGAALPELRKAFGDDVFEADGTLNRAALRDIVFNDPDQKIRLEQILHPMIRRQAIEALASATSPESSPMCRSLLKPDFCANKQTVSWWWTVRPRFKNNASWRAATSPKPWPI